uniref:Uncharacterized protein n=1 Tax=Entomoneis paludosa TaxID=265537 RepID=A0A7S2YFP7_9STRA
MDDDKTADRSGTETNAQRHFSNKEKDGNHLRAASGKSESLLGLIVGDDDFGDDADDDESTVYCEEEVSFSYRTIGANRTSSFMSKDTTVTNDQDAKNKRVRFESKALIHYFKDDDEDTLIHDCPIGEIELVGMSQYVVNAGQQDETKGADFVTSTRALISRLSDEQKAECEAVLCHLSCSFRKSSDKETICQCVTKLGNLFQISLLSLEQESHSKKKKSKKKKSKPSIAGKRTGTSMKSKVKANLVEHGSEADLTASTSSLEESDGATVVLQKEQKKPIEDTLRGLEAHLTGVYSSLHQQHRAAVLRMQHKLQKRLKKKTLDGSVEDEVGPEIRIRKASLKASRPLRHMAIQMAKYDTKEALRSVLSKWE